MSALELLDKLDACGIAVRVKGDKLALIGDQRQLADHGLMASLRSHKEDLIALLKRRAGSDAHGGIPAGTQHITPDMLPMVALEPAQIERLVQATPGGAANIQDIYPLVPLQEGILFHHRVQSAGDTYVLPTLLRFDSRQRLDGFMAALNEVIARHDILRTAVHWEGLAEPVQVVWRQARVDVRTLERAPQGGDAVTQLQAHADPSRERLDVRQAPMLRAYAMFDAATGTWLMQLLHHHLVLDHTASELLIGEIALLIQGRRTELEPPVPFGRFVAQVRQGMSAADHEAYFRRELGDVAEPTAPFGLMDVQGDGSAVLRYGARVEPALAARLRRQVKSRGVGAASLFHLAWARVLACCVGRDDVVFGTVLFGRMQGAADTARALGMFLNTLPLRVRMADTVEQGLKRTQAALAELLRHEYAPLTLAQRCSALPANVPLFSSLLNYRYSHEGEGEGKVLEGIEHLGGHDRTNYPFVLHVDDLGTGFELTAEIDHSVAAPRVVAFMLTALEGLVRALEHDPALPLAALDVLPPDERRQVLHDFNATATGYPAALLHELVERQAARTPAATAVRFEGTELGYGELNARANQLARHLRGLGVGPDRTVGVLLERSEHLVIALLAVVKAGGAYVPLDPSYPDERLAHMLRDSAPLVLLTQETLADRLAAPRLVLDTAATQALLAAHEDTNLDPAGLAADHLAYVIYTSGSTGQPKGVMNSHRGIVNRLQWMQQAYALGPRDVVLQKTPFGFDVSVWEFFWPLMTGAQLVLARPEGHKDPHYLGQVIEAAGVTTLHFVPSMLQVFLSQPDAVARCASVRQVMCSGEALPAALVHGVRAQLPQAQLHNLYGPTEAAVDVTAWTCTGEEGTAVPIGRPIANTRMYVLDTHGRPAPLGVAGELYIGGVQVARGYLNLPELSEERFLADPFVAGGRMYRTGDLGRWRPDGAIDYLGRNDFQVKLRGFRIELGEIEAQLLRQPGVREAVVLARPDGAGLVAYLVAEPAPEPADLRVQLGRHLPDYMIPAAYVTLDALPLGPNGKLDRKALPALDGAAFGRQAFEAPVGEVEQALAAIWSELLGIERIGRHDHFFELGGHSLLAIRLLEQLRQRGWSLDIRALFAHPSLAGMAAAIELARGAETPAMDVPPNAIPESFAASNEPHDDIEEFRL
nr:non-ribosomal peptide synthetase [Massilia sp. YMA4]